MSDSSKQSNIRIFKETEYRNLISKETLDISAKSLSFYELQSKKIEFFQNKDKSRYQGYSVLRATTSQSGNQCVANSVVFLATCFLRDPSNLISSDLDNIIKKGKNMYEYIMSSKQISESKDTFYLTVEEGVSQNVFIDNNEIQVDIIEIIQDILIYNQSYNKINLNFAIDYFQKNETNAILTLRDYSFSLISKNSCIYFFNSHSCDYQGYPLNDGVACMQTFVNSNFLTEFILKMFKPRNENLDDIFDSFNIQPLQCKLLNNNNLNSKNFTINNLQNEFIMKIPTWGGQYNDILFKNTCSIDYGLLALWFISQNNNNLIIFLKKTDNHLNNNILLIINLISNNEWNYAKFIWLTEVCKLTPISNTIDCFGTIFNMFSFHIGKFQLFKSSNCPNLECRGSILNPLFNRIYFENKKINYNNPTSICRCCKKQFLIERNFINPFPPFLIIENDDKNPITWKQLPFLLKVNNACYDLVCHIFSANATHFQSVFHINNYNYLIDDLNVTKIDSIIQDHIFISAIYCLN